MVTVLTSTLVNAGETTIVIVRPMANQDGSHRVTPNIYEMHTDIRDIRITLPKGAYYIGDYKRIDGTIAKDCYAEVLRSDDGVAMGTSIVCPDKNKSELEQK